MPAGKKNTPLAFFRLLRPSHWTKNLFVFAPIFFARHLLDTPHLINVIITFAAFCVASSSTYILNDIVDRDKDKCHSTKRARPIADGVVGIRAAYIFFIATAAIALMISLSVSKMVFSAVAVYMILMLLYSIVIKNIVILDVFALAAGFIIRLLGGAAAAWVMPSSWLILCTMMLSIFLGFTKRRAELATSGFSSANTRSVLEHYSEAFLDQMITIVTTGTVMLYVLYIMIAKTAPLDSPWLALTIPFVLYGVFRYLYLVYHLGRGSDPTQVLLTDIPMIINCILWAAACFGILYLA